MSVLATDQRGKLWHTIRKADGSWPYPWGDVNATVAATQGPPLDRSTITAAAIDGDGDLHVLDIDEPAGLYHTIRAANGAWPIGWQDVQELIVRQHPAEIRGVQPRLRVERSATISSEKDARTPARANEP